MNKLIVIISLLFALPTFADLYRCNSTQDSYKILIRNHQIIDSDDIAITVEGPQGVSTVLAKYVHFALGFTVDFSGPTSRSDEGFQELTIKVADPGSRNNFPAEASLSGQHNRIGFNLNCTRGNAPMPRP